MISISITEKAWDAVRPDSVKKTGLSEAVRGFQKANPGGAALKTTAAFDALDKAIDDLRDAIKRTLTAVTAAKDDKKNAAAKLKTWQTECDKALAEAQSMRTQAAVIDATVECDREMKQRVASTQDTLKSAGEALAAAKKDGAESRQLMRVLQEVNLLYRDNVKFTQKDSFKQMIATYPAIRAWKIDPGLVPLPPATQQLKAQLPLLQKLAADLADVAEQVQHASTADAKGDGADLAAKLVVEYRKLGSALKAFVPTAKQASAKVKEIADKWKPRIQGGAEPDKVLEAITRLHDIIHNVDSKTMAAVARGRTATGDLQRERLRIRATLTAGSDTFKQFESVTGNEWALVMATYQQISVEVNKALTQVDRLLRVVGEAEPSVKAQATTLLTQFDAAQKALKSKYQ